MLGDIKIRINNSHALNTEIRPIEVLLRIQGASAFYNEVGLTGRQLGALN